MAIVIKEIVVKAIVTGRPAGSIVNEEALEQLKKDIIKEIKETIRREKMQKQER